MGSSLGEYAVENIPQISILLQQPRPSSWWMVAPYYVHGLGNNIFIVKCKVNGIWRCKCSYESSKFRP